MIVSGDQLCDHTTAACSFKTLTGRPPPPRFVCFLCDRRPLCLRELLLPDGAGDTAGAGPRRAGAEAVDADFHCPITQVCHAILAAVGPSLNRCPDHQFAGFPRVCALSIRDKWHRAIRDPRLAPPPLQSRPRIQATPAPASCSAAPCPGRCRVAHYA